MVEAGNGSKKKQGSKCVKLQLLATNSQGCSIHILHIDLGALIDPVRAVGCCVQVDVRDTYQFTPLHSAANGGHVKTIQKLIQFCHDVDVKDYLGARHCNFSTSSQRH